MIFIIFILSIIIYSKIIKIDYLLVYRNYLKIHNYLDLSFHHKINNRIKIGTYSFYLKNGGRTRVTSFLLNYLSKIAIFDLYFFTNTVKDNNEYLFNQNITRLLIERYTIKNLIKKIRNKRIDIFYLSIFRF